MLPVGVDIFVANRFVPVHMLSWLFSDDPTIKHEEIRQKMYHGTGTWFFNTPEFKRWYDEPSWLFCHGQRISPYFEEIPLWMADWG